MQMAPKGGIHSDVRPAPQAMVIFKDHLAIFPLNAFILGYIGMTFDGRAQKTSLKYHSISLTRSIRAKGFGQRCHNNL